MTSAQVPETSLCHCLPLPTCFGCSGERGPVVYLLAGTTYFACRACHSDLEEIGGLHEPDDVADQVLAVFGRPPVGPDVLPHSEPARS